MIKYYDYITENEGLKLDGKNGFFMFLKLLDDLKFNFIKTNHFLNVGKFLYFFTTEHVRNKDKFYDYFRDCQSIKTTCDTALQLKDQRISCYFAVRDGKMEYGFQDDMKRDIYKTGQFDVDDRYIKSLKSFKCLALIEGVLKTANIKNLVLLHEIKSHLKFWYEDKGKVIILNENMLSKSVKKEDIKEDIKDPIAMLKKYEKWCEKFKWVDKVHYYLDTEDDDNVTFYIKIKPKEVNEEV